MLRLSLHAVLPLFALVLAACSGGGSSGVRIRGHVRLASGAPVEGASLRITWPDDPSLERTVFSAADGAWAWAWGDPGVAGFDWRHVVVEPELDGYAFDPVRHELVAEGAQRDLDFTAARVVTLRAGELYWTTEREPAVWRHARIELLRAR